MVSEINFKTSLNVLENLAEWKSKFSAPFDFDGEYKEHASITTALKILHRIAFFGTESQKALLLKFREKIIKVNEFLRSPLTDKATRYFSEHLSEIKLLKGMEIALPKTKLEQMLETASLIPRIAFAILLDLLLLPAALILCLLACCKVNFNPKVEEIKKGKVPILLLHGSGFNETEWIIGRKFLDKTEYGSVFSFNYDGLLSNDPQKGIEDYASEKVRKEIRRIKVLTGSNKVILIGHSMGGLIASYYAENFAKLDDVIIDHVFTIATPWHGSSTLEKLWKLGGIFSRQNASKRYLQMSVQGGTEKNPTFRATLVKQALESERRGIRKYYSIWSTTDFAVPCEQGCLTEDSRRQKSYNFLGHNSQMVWKNLWQQKTCWLDKIYINC